jgi:hypothetical protein
MGDLSLVQDDDQKIAAIEDMLNERKIRASEIERQIEMAKKAGEYLPPDILANWEEQKKATAGLDRQLAELKRLKESAEKNNIDWQPQSAMKTVWRIIFKIGLWIALPVCFGKFSKGNGYPEYISLILVFVWLAYSVYLIVSFFRGIGRGLKKMGEESAVAERDRQQAFVDTMNNFIDRHIDEVLAEMPPPTKSVRHRGSEYISYYWTKSTRSVYGGSIPVIRGIRMFSASGSVAKETLTMFVDPQTSRIVRWTHTGH